MNASKIIDAVISENLLDAKNRVNSILYNKTQRALEEKTKEITNKTYNDKCSDCNEEGDKEAYQKFFKSALKKFGVTEPDQLKGNKKKEFYNYVDKNWKSDAEKETGKEDPKENVELAPKGKGKEAAKKLYKKEGTETDIAKEKEKIAVSQERIKDLNDRQKREKRNERA